MLERDSPAPIPRVNLSVKVSALTPLLRPDAPERGQRGRRRAAARRCCAAARDLGAHLHVDMESLDSRETITRARARPARRARVRRRAVGRHRPAGLPARLAASSSTDLLDWARRSAARAHAADDPAGQGRLLGPRGRRGAPARLERRRCSRTRRDCDRNFEQLTRRLIDARAARPRGDRLAQPALGRARDRLRPPARRRRRATSSSRSCAGSATTSQDALAADGPPRARLLPGRRPRRRHGLPRAPAAREHLATTRSSPTRRSGVAARASCSRRRERTTLRATSRMLELRRAPSARELRSTRSPTLDAELPLEVPVLIGGERRARRTSFDSDRPGRRPTRVVADAPARRRRRRRRRRGRGRAAAAGAAWARDAAPSARRVLVARRRRSLRARRLELAALEVRECAKPWAEADADVCEAIDFLEYYARGRARARPAARRAAPAAGRAQRDALRRRAASPP